MLNNEPKLLKFVTREQNAHRSERRFSALQRAEIAEMNNETSVSSSACGVSVLFNEPKLLKSGDGRQVLAVRDCFSALQRAEIAEM